jgi:hypothetical protein
MKNYKILENRKELTPDQIKEGLDFNKIISNAGAVKSALLKALLMKASLGLIIISSLGVVYIKYYSASENKQSVVTHPEVVLNPVKNPETIVAKDLGYNKEISINGDRPEKKSILTISKVQPEHDTAGLIKQSIPKVIADSAVGKVIIVKDSLAGTEKNTNPEKAVIKSKLRLNKLLQVKTCKFWNVKEFCGLPENAKFPYSINCNACEYDYISCKDLKNAKAIWMTIAIKGNQKFSLESKFKNITITHANGKSSHPIAIAISNDEYLGKEFKTKTFIANYKQQMDIFLFFSEAQLGDVIIIDGQVEAVIED